MLPPYNAPFSILLDSSKSQGYDTNHMEMRVPVAGSTLLLGRHDLSAVLTLR